MSCVAGSGIPAPRLFGGRELGGGGAGVSVGVLALGDGGGGITWGWAPSRTVAGGDAAPAGVVLGGTVGAQSDAGYLFPFGFRCSHLLHAEYG